MKYILIALPLILLAGCKKFGKIEFDGTAHGVKSGTFIIKNLRDSTLYGVNIKDEKFTVNAVLPQPGYYTMDIVDDADKATHEKHYEVYLEPGKYTVETNAAAHYNYPKITSSAKIQNDLSDYYTLLDQQQGAATKDIVDTKDQLHKVMSRQHTIEENNSLVNKLNDLSTNEKNAELEALRAFAKKDPQSSISAHLMSGQAYDAHPIEYYDLFKTFTDEAKNSGEGIEIGTKLARLVKLQPGSQSPILVGNTPDGKPFDPSSIKKKIILVDFWRAVNQVSRLNHQDLENMLKGQINAKDFGIVSVSIDSKNDWWRTAITEDKMTWPQVSDLKGDDSQNATNWAISQIPTYYLVDGNWKIIARDIQLMEVPVYVNEYLAKH